MGRAKGGAQDNFSSLLGTRRGALEPDTLEARNPSERATQELHILIDDPSWLEAEETFRVLARKHTLINERPLLNELANAVSSQAAQKAFGNCSGYSAYLLEMTGLRTDHSWQLFVDSRDVLHLADGEEYGINPHLKTVCGIPLARSDVYPYLRGSWRASLSVAPPGTKAVTKCPECQKEERRFDDCWERQEEVRFPSDEREQIIAEIKQAVRQKLEATLNEGQAASADDLSSFATELCRSKIIPKHIAKAITDGSKATIYHALQEEDWKTIVKQGKADNVAGTLELEDVEDWLGFYAPPSLTVPEDGNRAKYILQARKELFNMLAADLGIKRH